MPQLVPGGRGKSALKELETAIESLDHDLMRLEMQLVEQLDVSGLCNFRVTRVVAVLIEFRFIVHATKL